MRFRKWYIYNLECQSILWSSNSLALWKFGKDYLQTQFKIQYGEMIYSQLPFCYGISNIIISICKSKSIMTFGTQYREVSLQFWPPFVHSIKWVRIVLFSLRRLLLLPPSSCSFGAQPKTKYPPWKNSAVAHYYIIWTINSTDLQ